MSTRQNKKQRKVRKDANARERTVTTLTEDPNTHYLVPTPSEEPAVSIGAKMHGMSMGPPVGYPMQSSNYGYGFSAPFSPMQSMQQQQQQQPYFPSPQSRISSQSQQVPVPDVRPKIPLPPGQNDLEILKNLKKLITDNQHPFYKAIPNPEALARFYKGKTATSQPQSWTRTPDDITMAPPESHKPPARQQRGQGKDRRLGAGNNHNQVNRQPGANIGSLDISNLNISKGPTTTGPPPEVSTEKGDTQDQGQLRAHTQRPVSFSAGGHPGNSAYDPRDMKEEIPRGNWPARDSDDRERYPADGPSIAAPPSSTAYDRDRPRRDDWSERGYDHGSIESSRYSGAEHGPPPVARGLPSVEANVTAAATRHVSDVPPSGDIRPVDSRPLPPPDNGGGPPASLTDRLGPGPDIVIKQEPQTISDIPIIPGLSQASAPAPAPTGDLVPDPSSARPSLKDRINPPMGQITPSTSDQPPDRSKRPYVRPHKGPNYGGPPTSVGPGGPHSNYRGSSPPSRGGPGYRRSASRDASYSGPPRGYDPRLPALDVRPKVPPPGGPPGSRADYRARDDAPRGRSYRPESWADSYPGGIDARYDDRRYRDYSPGRAPHLPSGGRDPIAPDGPPGRDYHQYPPPGNARSDWEDDYYKSRAWDGPPPRSSEGYERDYPPRHPGYNSRPERDYVARDGYPGRPPPPIDDRYPPGPPPRDGDRRPPPPPGGYGAPASYNRVRARSASPRRGPQGPDDPRPPLKRPREDDYYPPGRNDSMRRPQGDYPHGPPPRSGSSGPPPLPVSSASSGWGPPPPSSGSGAPPATGGAGPPLDRDRDYHIGSMDYPPPPASGGGNGYRPRSPLPPSAGGGGVGRNGPYPNRGGYGRGAGDRGYGPPRP